MSTPDYPYSILKDVSHIRTLPRFSIRYVESHGFDSRLEPQKFILWTNWLKNFSPFISLVPNLNSTYQKSYNIIITNNFKNCLWIYCQSTPLFLEFFAFKVSSISNEDDIVTGAKKVLIKKKEKQSDSQMNLQKRDSCSCCGVSVTCWLNMRHQQLKVNITARKLIQF